MENKKLLCVYNDTTYELLNFMCTEDEIELFFYLRDQNIIDADLVRVEVDNIIDF